MLISFLTRRGTRQDCYKQVLMYKGLTQERRIQSYTPQNLRTQQSDQECAVCEIQGYKDSQLPDDCIISLNAFRHMTRILSLLRNLSSSFSLSLKSSKSSDRQTDKLNLKLKLDWRTRALLLILLNIIYHQT